MCFNLINSECFSKKNLIYKIISLFKSEKHIISIGIGIINY